MTSNADAKELWGSGSLPDLTDIIHSCIGYANSPGWAFISRIIEDTFSGFKDLKTIELGCGEGKVSLLCSFLGAKTTLIDYSPKQLKRANYIAEKFKVAPLIKEEDLLQLPKSHWGKYDISMSYGTAEHFFGKDRQKIFKMHFNVLRKGGLSIIWVPNRYGVLFHFGVLVRKFFHRPICSVDEVSFTRKELFKRAKRSGFKNIEIVGGESLKNDFSHFLFDFSRLLNSKKDQNSFHNADDAKSKLLNYMALNNASLKPWNNLLSYALILFGRRV
jgi:SAM-dependent methyltransferase